MKKLVAILTMVMALTVGSLIPASAEESSKIVPTVDLDLTFNSKYVWRGMLLVDDWVAQPSVTAGIGGFSVNVWGDYNLTDENGKQKEFDEIDITLDYTFSLGDFSIPVGVIVYTFPGGGNDTSELYVGLGYDWIVSPSVTVYHDVDEVAGAFYILGSLDYSYELPVGDKVSASIDLGASIGWGNEEYNTGYFGVEDPHFTDWSVSLAIPIGFCEYFTVTPAVTYTALVDSEIRDAGKAAYTEDSNVFYGISFTASF